MAATGTNDGSVADVVAPFGGTARDQTPEVPVRRRDYRAAEWAEVE